MLHQQAPYKLLLILLAILFFVTVVLCSKAYAYATDYPLDETPDAFSLWTTIDEYVASQKLYFGIKEKRYILGDVDFETFDTIFVLVNQLCNENELDIYPSLILAMIGVESRYDVNAKNGNARGLMQLIPAYHQDRMLKYLDDPNYSTDIFFDPRYNLACGIDYISYTYSETNDLAYALMWYNQGAVSACEDHEMRGYTSRYAKDVIALKEYIDKLI